MIYNDLMIIMFFSMEKGTYLFVRATIIKIGHFIEINVYSNICQYSFTQMRYTSQKIWITIEWERRYCIKIDNIIIQCYVIFWIDRKNKQSSHSVDESDKKRIWPYIPHIYGYIKIYKNKDVHE